MHKPLVGFLPAVLGGPSTGGASIPARMWLRRFASGDIQIGDIGSSPFAAALGRAVPIEAVALNALTGGSEALVVRNGAHIDKPQELIGKTIATLFVSTSHYSLLAALKHWGIDAKQVRIVNLGPTESVAAWARGDIDAAYTWDPALGKTKQTGKVLVDSTQVAQWDRRLSTYGLLKDFRKRTRSSCARS